VARRLASAAETGGGKVEIGHDPRKGRALYARAPIAPGELIDASPVIVLTAAECALVERTRLGHYYFHWDGDFDGDGTGAVALGLATLCNHSSHPNARTRRNYAAETLDIVATAPIRPGDEVTIDYGCKLWFEPSE
jgi:SET domain-containing protein